MTRDEARVMATRAHHDGDCAARKAGSLRGQTYLLDEVRDAIADAILSAYRRALERAAERLDMADDALLMVMGQPASTARTEYILNAISNAAAAIRAEIAEVGK